MLQGLKNRREHAGFFEALGKNGPDRKQRKERGVVLEWLHTQFDEPDQYVHRIQSCAQEPPDVVVHLIDGTVLGIEVTEMVDEEQVSKNAAKKGGNANKHLTAKLRDYSGDTLRSSVQQILQKKNGKLWNRFAPDSASKKRILLIHSDEKLIEPNGVENLFDSQEYTFDSVWLLMPDIPLNYDYTSGKCCRSICMLSSDLLHFGLQFKNKFANRNFKPIIH